MENELKGRSILSSSSIDKLIPWMIYRLNMHLSSVVGYTELLLSKTSESKFQRELKKINEEAHQASQVIKDLLNFTRKRVLKKEVVNINKLIDSLISEEMDRLSLSNIKVVRELSPELPLTIADAKQIQQALRNIINYAEEAIREFHGFGEIRVKTSEVEGQIKIFISDDGPGVTSEEISRVFDPLFSWFRRRGTGLELALSRSIVVDHGGKWRLKVNGEREALLF